MASPNLSENNAPTPRVIPVAPVMSPLAGLLSYLVPGLGQIYQGRVSKGLLFMVCLYGLFFYGMYLGNWSNVYVRPLITSNNAGYMRVVDRLPFAGQFPIGVAVWPAILQHNGVELPGRWRDFMKTPPEDPDGRWKGKSLKELQSEGDKFWDLGWVYTIIAGMLNILVIYDAIAGPAFVESEGEKDEDDKSRKEEAVAV